MKMGLIFPNKDRKDKAVHLGLGYLASFTRNVHSDLEITILDTRVAKKSEINQFFHTSFDLVCITVLSPVYYEVIHLVDTFRDLNPTIKICLGGPYVTTIMEEIFKEIPADFAIYGEGEQTLTDLIYHLKGQKEIETIHGLLYISSSGETITNAPRAQFTDLDSLPFPAYDLFQMERYPIHRIVTSRGCPYECSFCNSSSIWQYNWRKRSPENLILEIEYLIKNFRRKTFFFNDNSFNIQMDRVEEFCERLINKKLDILWSTPVRIENITQGLADKMKKAGCYNVGIGIESANNDILASIGKRVTIEEVTKGIRIFKKAEIEVLGQFVIGSPGDTLTTVKESLNYAKHSELDFVMFYSVLPFKGTHQWDYVNKFGKFYSKTIHDYHFIKPRIVFDTPEFPYNDRLEAIRLAKNEGYYCDSNDRNSIFDLGRGIVQRAQSYLPEKMGNKIYLSSKYIYRKWMINRMGTHQSKVEKSGK
ncbi:MAG: radical SAM protein [Bacteroidales bacterium]|nr:radical SAM protein [Bacteroidales bacterium]